MKLINNGTNPLAHGKYKLPKGAVVEIPDEIAKDWLKIKGIKQYVSGADLAQATQKADAEKKALQAEIEKLKAELAKAQEDKTETPAKSLDELKKEADELGVEYPANIGVVKLQERIDKKKAETAEK